MHGFITSYANFKLVSASSVTLAKRSLYLRKRITLEEETNAPRVFFQPSVSSICSQEWKHFTLS